MPLPKDTHPRHDDRDTAGRFAVGNPGRPPGKEVSRLRSDAQRLLVAHFARNQDSVLDQLLRQNPSRYLDMVMLAANEADNRALPDLDPGAPPPVDLEAINREAEARRIANEAKEAKAHARIWGDD